MREIEGRIDEKKERREREEKEMERDRGRGRETERREGEERGKERSEERPPWIHCLLCLGVLSLLLPLILISGGTRFRTAKKCAQSYLAGLGQAQDSEVHGLLTAPHNFHRC